VRRFRYRLGFWLYGIANWLDPGAEHEFYVCPECNEKWKRR
jgi:hypothetical protein